MKFRNLLLAGPIAAGCLWAMPAAAQQGQYNCQNEKQQVEIEALPVRDAIAAFTEQTRCPVSIEGKVDGATSRRLRGSLTPRQALTTLLTGTGLRGQVIRQGFKVTGTARRAPATAKAGQRPVAYNCQNASQRVTIAAMPLDKAIAELSRQTRCPIDLGFQVSGLRSRAVKGTYTPLMALRAAIEGTGLSAQMVRQGLQVLPVR